MTYLLRRGRGYRRRKAHLARYDSYGRITGAWCGRPYNLTSNVTWGCNRCKDCIRRWNKDAA
jgi:hypothetical protein